MPGRRIRAPRTANGHSVQGLWRPGYWLLPHYRPIGTVALAVAHGLKGAFRPESDVAMLCPISPTARPAA